MAGELNCPLRTLGRTGMEVSAIGLGTVKLGRRQGVKYPRSFELPDDRSARALLDTARALGINLVDTAPAYGESEARLGALLAGSRDRWLISTKVGESFQEGRSTFDFSPEAVRGSIERSLARLRTDRLDIVLIHSDGNDEQILNSMGTLECLQELKGRGLVRAVGISHKTTAGAELAMDRGADVLMTTLNLAEQSEAELIRHAAGQGVGVLVKKPLASGHLALDSLRFAAGTTGVSSVVVGTIDPGHLEENVRAIADL